MMYIVLLLVGVGVVMCEDFPEFPIVQFTDIDEAEYWRISEEQRSRHMEDDFMMVIMRPSGCLQCDLHALLLDQVYTERLGPSIRHIVPIYQHHSRSSNISKTLYYDQTRSQIFTSVVRAGLGVDFLDMTFFKQEFEESERWEAKKDHFESFIRNHARITSWEVFSAEDVLDRHNQFNKSSYTIVYFGHDIANNVREYRMFSQTLRPEDNVLALHAFSDQEAGQEIMQYFNMDQDSCFLILNGDDYEDVQCPQKLTSHFVMEVVKTYLYGRVLNLSNKRDAGRIKFYGDTALIVFMKEENEQYLDTLNRLATDLEGKLLFGYQVQGTEEWDENYEMAELSKDTKYQYPITVIMQTKSGKRSYLYEGKFDYSPVKTFIKGYFRSEVVVHYRTQAVPKQLEDDPFIEVVGSTFHEHIMLSNKSALLFLYENRTCETCLKVVANITNATTDFTAMVNLFAMNTNKNKSPFCHVWGSPRLVLYMNQSEFANKTVKELERTHLPGKLYYLFPSDQFVVENVVKFLYERIFNVKMEATNENGEDISDTLKPLDLDFSSPEAQEKFAELRELLHRRKQEDIEEKEQDQQENTDGSDVDAHNAADKVEDLSHSDL